MKALAAFTMTLLGFVSNVYADTVYKEISLNTVTRTTSIKTLETELNSTNCTITASMITRDRVSTGNELAYAHLCEVNLSDAAAPLRAEGYKFGHLDYRDLGGNFKSGIITTVATGWDFDIQKMPVLIVIKKKDASSKEEANALATSALNSGALKLRMTFDKITCLQNGKDVSNDPNLCKE